MKRIVLFFALLLSFQGVFAKYTPSESARVSVLICSPGLPIYSQFGHAAVRIQDTVAKLDAVFDYGTFDMSDISQFIRNFLSGETYYLLDARPFDITMWAYRYEGRGIQEYVLNLSHDEVQQISNYLLQNLRPENQQYLYNFFYDNCATRIRDILQNQFPDLQWNSTYQSKTWRELIVQYMGTQSWETFGANMALGIGADKLATTNEMMFLPDALADGCLHAKINDTKPLLLEKKCLLEPLPQKATSLWNNATLILWIFATFIFICTAIELFKKKRFFVVDIIFFLLMGLFGCVLWILSFSIHSFVSPNCNILWLTPLHMIFAVALCIPTLRNKIEWYFLFAALATLVALVLAVIFGQYIPPTSIPLILLFIARVFPRKTWIFIQTSKTI